MVDPFSPDSPPVLPIGQATDGVFVWPLCLASLVQSHRNLQLPEDLLTHIGSRGSSPTVSESQIEEVREYLLAEAVDASIERHDSEDLSQSPFG